MMQEVFRKESSQYSQFWRQRCKCPVDDLLRRNESVLYRNHISPAACAENSLLPCECGLCERCATGVYIAISRPKGIMKKPYNHCSAAYAKRSDERIKWTLQKSSLLMAPQAVHMICAVSYGFSRMQATHANWCTNYAISHALDRARKATLFILV